MAPLPEGPIWAAATLLAGLLAKAVHSLAQRRNGGSGLSSLVGRMEKTLDQTVVQQAATTTALTGVTVVLTRLTDRLENLPSKMDVMEGFERSRHDLRNIVGPLTVAVGELEATVREQGKKT